MKKFALLLALVAALFSVACASAPGGKALSADVAITIIHTNDMHARGLETATEVGYARLAAYVGALKAKNPNVLVLDAGDTLHGLPWANLERGAPVIKLMEAVGYDAMTTGNHDYNYGFDRLSELAKGAKFPVLAANVYKDGARPFKPYVIKEVGGVRVAIVGLATQETTYKSDPAGIKGVVFENPVAELSRLVRGDLAGAYDILVVLSHIGLDGSSNPMSTALLESVPEIDLLIDGHSHSDLVKAQAAGAKIVSTGANGVGFGVVDLVVGKDRKVASLAAKTVTMKTDPTLASDPAVKAIADGIKAAQAPMLAEVVGNSSIELVGVRDIVRTSESNLGRLIANGMLATTGADIALMNGGGIRVSIPAGQINKGQVYTVLPFGNYLWTTSVKGSELDAIVEHGVGKLPAADGRYPHFAGLSFTLDAAKPAGERVSNILVKGAAVDPAKSYTLATLNFLFAGGDGYTMLVGKAYKEYPIDADSFMSYVKSLGTITEANISFRK